MLNSRTSLRITFTALLLAVTCLTAFQPSAKVTNIRAVSASGLAAAPAAPPADSPFGIAGVMRWPAWGTFGQPADLMMETGGAWVRDDFVWSLIQPAPDQWEWEATDRIVGELGGRGLNMLGVIAYSASWATPNTDDDGSPMSFYPPNLDQYYNFVHTLVGRYKNVVRHWEVWNEPDNGVFWKPAPDARQYAELLKVAYRAIKDADPDARVVTGGVSGNAIPYLEEMLAAGAGDSFDILAIHPYAVPLDPGQGRIESSPEVHKMVEVELAKYSAFLSRHNLQRPLWVTEVGWPAVDWGLDDSLQADYVAQNYALMLSSGLVERVFAYSFKDASNDPRDSWGLVAWGNNATDLNPRRQSFYAYATSARFLTGASPGGRVQLSPANAVVDFEAGSEWARSMQGDGALASSADVSFSGTRAGKFEYRLHDINQAVDFSPAQPVALPGNPTRMGVWALGDGSGNYLSAWLRDRDGELFKVRLGAMMGQDKGWRYYEAPINSYYFAWERAGGNPANSTLDYPLEFVTFRLENTPDEPAGGGTIYLDDLQTWEGPDVSSVRFNRDDGTVVDVIWSAQPTNAFVPTSSTAVQVFSRDGTEWVVEVKDGRAVLPVSSSPIYVLHMPVGGVQKIAVPEQLDAEPSALCLAAVPTSNIGAADNLYFPETGHNLAEPFRSYWQARGGISILGFPITEVFDGPLEDGNQYRQQYFERARLEYHPEFQAPADIQLGLLGVWAAQRGGGAHVVQAQALTGGLFFPETGHTVNLFALWWQANGGIPTFGFPISPEVPEQNSADGNTYTVQYFERNRLEHHPEYAGSPEEVLLGLLGTEYVAAQGCR